MLALLRNALGKSPVPEAAKEVQKSLQLREGSPQESLPRETRFLPVRPSRCEVGPDASPSDVAERLRTGNVCLMRSALPHARSAQMRSITEQKMGLIDGGLHANIFCDRQEDGSIEIDVSIILHVLASPCLAAVRSYFGAEPLIQMANFLVRRLDAQDKRIMDLHVPHHQDGFGYNETNVDVVNCWTLLSPDECGLTSPGLEFILDRVGHVLGLEESPRPSSYSHQEPSYRKMAEYLDAYDPWQPSIRLGDVALFNKLSIHRTWLHQGQTKPRYSAELRLMPNDAINRAFNETRKQAVYTVSGETLAGPSRIRYHSNGSIEVLACSEWSIIAPGWSTVCYGGS